MQRFWSSALVSGGPMGSFRSIKIQLDDEAKRTQTIMFIHYPLDLDMKFNFNISKGACSSEIHAKHAGKYAWSSCQRREVAMGTIGLFIFTSVFLYRVSDVGFDNSVGDCVQTVW